MQTSPAKKPAPVKKPAPKKAPATKPAAKKAPPKKKDDFSFSDDSDEEPKKTKPAPKVPKSNHFISFHLRPLLLYRAISNSLYNPEDSVTAFPCLVLY